MSMADPIFPNKLKNLPACVQICEKKEQVKPAVCGAVNSLWSLSVDAGQKLCDLESCFLW